MFEPILRAAWEGWWLVFSWPNILYPITATLLAMTFSSIPGLSGVILMALAIPFTLGWDPLQVMLVFGALVGGATFMGSVTAILFNIPGRNSSVATMIDGYPMTQKGEAKTAIACSAAASALGSSFGIVVLVLLLPFLREATLFFGPPELLLLAVWGLTTLAMLTRDSVVKGLAAACLGLLLSFVGVDPQTAEPRYTFGTLYLRDGLSLVPVFLGLFALAGILELAVSGRLTISGKTRAEQLTGEIWQGVCAVWRHFGLFLRSSIIGTVVGMIPGIGATIASFLAYSHAAQTSRDREGFGRGDIRGVLAPEAANDAKDGGSLVPALALGIPGGSGTALLLVAMAFHGLTPGREMLTQNLSLAFVLIWSMFLSNWLTSILGLALVNPLSHLTLVRTHFLLPVILVLATQGAYMYRGLLEDVLVAYLFAVAGYYMKVFGWPRIPLMIALVLGPLLENSLQITLRLHELGRINIWTRPVVLLLLGLSIVTLTLPCLQAWKRVKVEEDTG